MIGLDVVGFSQALLLEVVLLDDDEVLLEELPLEQPTNAIARSTAAATDATIAHKFIDVF